MGTRTFFIPLGSMDENNYYTKDEINQMFSEQSGYTVVSTLPTTGDPTKIYLVGPTGSGADQYEEYVYADDNWVKIGDTSMDLSGYVTDTELGTALAAKQDTLTAGTGIAIGTDNVISADLPTLATVATSGNYADLSGTPTIGTGTVTLTQNGATIGTFGLNDTDDKTIEIPAGGSSSNAWYGTMAQFNAISTKDPDTDYYISDISYSEIKGTPNLSVYETKADSQAADQALDAKIAGKMNNIVFLGTGGIASIGTPLEGVTYAVEGETLPLTFTLDGIGTVTYNFVID